MQLLNPFLHQTKELLCRQNPNVHLTFRIFLQNSGSQSLTLGQQYCTNLAEMQILGSHPWPTDLESLEKGGPASYVLTTPVNSQSRSRLTSHASELNEKHQNRWNSPGSALEAVSKTKRLESLGNRGKG